MPPHRETPAAPAQPIPNLVPEALELVELVDTLFTVAVSEHSSVDQKPKDSTADITTTSAATTAEAAPTEIPKPSELGVDNEADVFQLRQNVESFILSHLAQSMGEWKEKRLQEMFAEQAKARERLEDQLFISTNAEYPDYEAAIRRIAELEAQLVLQAEGMPESPAPVSRKPFVLHPTSERTLSELHVLQSSHRLRSLLCSSASCVPLTQ